MKHLLISLLVFTATSVVSFFAQAQMAKVIKVKGQQAIVMFPPGTSPQVGQQLDVGAVAPSGAPSENGSRQHLIGLGINDLYFLNNSKTSKSRTGLDLNGRYGWNTGKLEYGAIGNIGYQSEDNDTTTSLLGGGFFDFNFVPNVSGQGMVYGVGADLMFGQESKKTGPLDASTTLIDLFVGGNVKWFGLSDHFCLRGDAGFNLQRSTPDSGSATNLVGLMVRGGLAAYF